MSSNTFRARLQPSAVNNENPLKNVKNSLITNRKQSALKVLTNTVQTSSIKSNGKGAKQLKVLPMKRFETDQKSRSPFKNRNYDAEDEFDHTGCKTNEKDVLPSSMTCNIDMLSNFFDSKSDESDWLLEDFNNIMNSKIQKTFEDFGESDVDLSLSTLPPMPMMDFSDCMF